MRPNPNHINDRRKHNKINYTAEDDAATKQQSDFSGDISIIYLRRTLHTPYSSRSKTRLVPAAPPAA